MGSMTRTKKLHTYVLGILQKKAIGKRAKTYVEHELPEYSLNGLDEAQIRCNWEIAQIVSASDKKLITHSHRNDTKLPLGFEKTVPTLQKTDNNGHWQTIHSHFSEDLNNPRWCVDHLDCSKLDDSHISEFICNYGWKNLKADKNKNGGKRMARKRKRRHYNMLTHLTLSQNTSRGSLLKLFQRQKTENSWYHFAH